MNEVIGINGPPKVRLWMSAASILLGALLFVAAVAFAGGTLRPFASTSTQPSTDRVVLAVEGMYCDSCAAGIRSQLKRTHGVVAAQVSYKEKQAIVDYDSQKTTPEKIVEVINNLGYKATVKNKT